MKFLLIMLLITSGLVAQETTPAYDSLPGEYSAWYEGYPQAGYPKYTISYNANGGSSSTASQTVDSTYSVQLRSNSFTRTGYSFTGWNNAADGGGTSYNPGAEFYPMSDTTLYAQWAINSYIVTYNGNGGTGTQTDVNSPYTYGATVTIMANEFNRGNWVFDEWNTVANGSGSAYQPAGTFTIPANNIILYAQWLWDTLSIDSVRNISTGTDSGYVADTMRVSYYPGSTGGVVDSFQIDDIPVDILRQESGWFDFVIPEWMADAGWFSMSLTDSMNITINVDSSFYCKGALPAVIITVDSLRPNPWYRGKVFSIYGANLTNESLILAIGDTLLGSYNFISSELINDTIPSNMPRGKYPFKVNGVTLDSIRVFVPKQGW